MSLIFDSVTRKVGGETHLDRINLGLDPGTTHVVLGRTLSGKTSLLRLMAGLDRPTSGRILMNGKDVTGLFVRKRSVAMVYQQFINYPSLTVYRNIASPLKMSGLKKSEIDRKVRSTAAMLHIEELLDRLPAELSGGQQQRTAIARSLVKEAELLLLDEPLVNLDYKLREELRLELQEIFKQRQAIVVYTTTEPTEALLLGGQIIVIDEGRILQTGPTPTVYHHPASLKVAEVFSDPPINFLDGTVQGLNAHLGKGLQIPLMDHLKSLAPGNYTFGLRSHHLFLKRVSPEDAVIRARVELAEINGSETFIHVDYEGCRLVVQEDGIFPHQIGSEIKVYVNPCCLFVYDRAGALVASPTRGTIPQKAE
ncbi:MAG: ABC transporter ATP-binding protein [Thermodesulfobacteriota bacterium]